ncbi:hypothetical protein E2I00_018245, partial [Balaenoptera physalus]
DRKTSEDGNCTRGRRKDIRSQTIYRVGESAETAVLGASLRLGELELKEDWQDEEFPRLLPEEADPSGDPHNPERDSQAGTPSTLAPCGQRPMRKRLCAPELRLNLTKGPGDNGASPTHSVPSSPDGSSDLEIDELETPSDSEQLDSGHEFEREDELPQAEGLGASEAAERLGQGCMWDVAGEDGHCWRVFRTGQREQRVDMTVIEPYKKVLSHGGYHGDGLNVVILFASCYLPRSSIPDYTYVMEHLFRYMVGTLELLIAENYLLVHLSGGTSRAQVPPLSWIRQCYHTLDRRLRKNLHALVVVHATWYVKAFLTLLRPFISSKFTRKIRFLNSLGELAQLISLDQVHIPEAVRRLGPRAAGAEGLTSTAMPRNSLRFGGPMTRSYRTTARSTRSVVSQKMRVTMEDEDDVVAVADSLAGPAAAELLASTVSTGSRSGLSAEEDGSLEEGVVIYARKNNTDQWSTARSTRNQWPPPSPTAMPAPEDLRLVLMPWGPWHCHCKSGTMSRTRAGKLRGLSGRLRVGALSQLRTEHRPCTYHQCPCNREREECPLDAGLCPDTSCTTQTTTRATTTTPFPPLVSRLRPTPFIPSLRPNPALAFWKRVRTGLEDIWNSLSAVFTEMQPVNKQKSEVMATSSTRGGVSISTSPPLSIPAPTGYF